MANREIYTINDLLEDLAEKEAECDRLREANETVVECDTLTARVAELEAALARVRALPTFDLCHSQMGGGLENRRDEFGDWYSADDVQEAIGWDPTEPTMGAREAGDE